MNLTDTAATSGAGIDPIFISVQQAAKALGISPWSCYQLLDDNKIESRYQGRRRLVRVESLRAYADTLPTTAPGESA